MPGSGVDRRAAVVACAIEGILIALALYGGPHGLLGRIPWMLQLPGILLVLYPAGGGLFALRVVGMGLIQATLWYTVIAAARRRRGRLRAGPVEGRGEGQGA